MTWPVALLTHLTAGSTGLEIGANALINVMPDELDQVTFGLFEQPGFEADEVFGDTDAWLKPSVKVIVRTTEPVDGASAPDPAVARAAAWEAYRAAKTVGNEVLTGSTWRFGAVHPAAPPFLEDIDERGRHRYTFTAAVWLAPSTAAW